MVIDILFFFLEVTAIITMQKVARHITKKVVTTMPATRMSTMVISTMIKEMAETGEDAKGIQRRIRRPLVISP